MSTTLSVLLLSTMLSLPASAAIHSNVPQEVEKFALSEGLAHAKKMLAIVPADIGLPNADEISTLTLGPGLQLNLIDWEKLKKSDSSSLLFDAETNATEPMLVVNKNVRYLVGKHKEQEVAIPDLTGERASILNNMSNQKLWPAADIVKTLKDKEEAAAAQNVPGLVGGSGATSSQLPNKENNLPLILAGVAGFLGLFGIGAYSVRKKTNK